MTSAAPTAADVAPVCGGSGVVGLPLRPELRVGARRFGALVPKVRRSRGAWLATAVVTLVVTGLVLAGCGRNEFKDRTAKVAISSRTTAFQLDSCGLDGSTLFVVGRSEGGEVLQAVVGLDDERTGLTESTGVTVSDDGADLAAFGAESWERRGKPGDPPGEVRQATLRGSRIQVAGRLATVGDGAAPTATSTDVTFTLDARCDDQDA